MSHVINYKNLSERIPDDQYRKLLKRVTDEGKDFIPIHASLPENQHLNHKGSKDVTGHMLEYDLSNGFPLDPIRDLSKSFRGGLAEICAFLNGARTLDELTKFGVPKKLWGNTATEKKGRDFNMATGDLGPGSYGPALREMPGPDGRFFDQIRALENNAKKSPSARTLAITTWYPPYALGDQEQGFPRRVLVAPCHGNFTRFKLYGDTKEMHVITVPRSSDAPVGLIFNIFQWCAVGMMLADLLDYRLTKYVMMVMDPQIYDIQSEAVRELLAREPRKLPSVFLKPAVKRNHLWEYRPEDFFLLDYDPHPRMEIPVTT